SRRRHTRFSRDWSSDVCSSDLKNMREVFYNSYVKNCNVIGATCSSIGKHNKVLSDLLSTMHKKNIKIPTAFYKQYCEIFGKKNRSEERRVGKECSRRWSVWEYK